MTEAPLLAQLRAWYAEELRFAGPVESEAVVRAFASVPRERSSAQDRGRAAATPIAATAIGSRQTPTRAMCIVTSGLFNALS